jgi:ankyrin repeat protein
MQQRSDRGDCALHVACMVNKIEDCVYLKLINDYPMAIQLDNCYGNYPLHIACHRGDISTIILKLIEMNLDIIKKTY